MAVLIMFSVIGLFVGFLFLNDATMGVGIIGVAGVFAIFARIAQAAEQHAAKESKDTVGENGQHLTDLES